MQDGIQKERKCCEYIAFLASKGGECDVLACIARRQRSGDRRRSCFSPDHRAMSVVSSYSASSYTPSRARLSLANQALTSLPEDLERRVREEGVEELILAHNRLSPLPTSLGSLSGLRRLDVSNNSLTELPDEIGLLERLEVLVAKRNQLKSLPDSIARLGALRELNVSGNRLEKFPPQLVSVARLESLHLGGNRLRSVPSTVGQLSQLSNLYLGGNQLEEVPSELGQLHKLSALVLCDNQLQSLPPQLAQLTHLTSLRLHNNQLQTLPRGIVQLMALRELSLRGNPLVYRFVRDWADKPPTLLELSARTLLKNSVRYPKDLLPGRLAEYLQTARHCDNPACNGVYFQSHVQSVTFVDFCGKYRIPLMEYLCSPMCAAEDEQDVSSSSSSSSGGGSGVGSSEEEEEGTRHRMKRVLLG